MTLKCPCCGRNTVANAQDNTTPDTMFFPLIDGNDKELVFCVACRNVVSGPPVDGCLFLPSDELLAANLAAIQQTARHIRNAELEVGEKAKPRTHKGPGEGYHVHEDGAIEFCFRKSRTEKFVMNMVKGALDKIGFANAHPAGTSRLCRQQCPSKKGYEHVRVKIVALTVETSDG